MNIEQILEALIRANRAGARGMQLVGFTMNNDATCSSPIMLVLQQPDFTSASEREWFNKEN